MRMSTANRPVRLSSSLKADIDKMNQERYEGRLPFSKASEQFSINYQKMSEYIRQKGELPKKKGGLL